MAGVRPCPSVGGALAVAQMERPGEGRPNYSRNHMRRQRESVRAMLCPMCGTPTPAEDRWTQTARVEPAGVLRARGLAHLAPMDASDDQLLLNAGAIAPLHRACAERSRLHCPYLGALDQTEILPFPQTWKVSPLFVEARPAPTLHVLNPGLQSPPQAVPVISFLQICGVTAERDRRWRRRLRG